MKQIKRIATPQPAVIRTTAETLPTAGIGDQYGLTRTKPVVVGARLPDLSKAYLFAGRAVFTVSNAKTNEHFTFRVRQRASKFNPDQHVFFISIKDVAVQYGYAFLGMLNERDGSIKATGKAQYHPGQKPYDVAAWATKTVVAGKMIPDNYKIEHAGKCGRCGRALTDPESIKSGIGPDCRKIMGI